MAKFEEVVAHLFDALSTGIKNAGERFENFNVWWFPELDFMKEWYDPSIRKNQFLKATTYISDLIGKVNFYNLDGTEMIELSDSHTLWRITEEVPDGYNFEAEYTERVQQAEEAFYEKFNTEIGCYGRSGRHVCVEINLENLERYDEYIAFVVEQEESIIDYFNNLPPKPLYEGNKLLGQIPVNGGFLDVRTASDPDYPGVDIEFIPLNEEEIIKNNPEYTRPRVLLETPFDDNILRVLCWANPNLEDYSHNIKLCNTEGE